MIIRSQDKGVITRDLDLWFDKSGNEYRIQNKEFNLGWYSTKGKTIKVLDMIQSAYAKCESVKTLTSGTSFEVTTHFKSREKVEEYTNLHREKFVFQMPQDSEV